MEPSKMLPSKPGLHRHSQRYKQALLQLQSKYSVTTDLKEKKKLLDEFSDSHLMPMEYWMIRLQLEVNPRRGERFGTPLHQKALQHFCHDFKIHNYYTSDMLVYRQTKPFEMDDINMKKILTFPNRKLQATFLKLKEEYLKQFPVTLPKKVDEMEKLYEQIMESESDQEKWIQLLQESKNEKFVKKNIEHRISFNLCNKSLWKLYIKYLKENDDMTELLQVYSKYCRFFMDDSEMLEEYKKAAENEGEVLVKWKNPFHFETKDPNEEELMFEYGDWDDDNEGLPPNNFFEFQNFVPRSQAWFLPSPLIRYARNNANPIVLKKMHQTCKIFFVLKPKILCYRFLFHSSDSATSSFMQQEIMIWSSNSFYPMYNKNLHITSALEIFHTNPNLLSNFIRKCIYRCDAQLIQMPGQKITEKEFEFLVGHGNVELLSLGNTAILDEEGQNMGVTDILKMLPKIRVFEMENGFPSKTGVDDSLSKLQFQNKLIKFRILAFKFLFDADDFCEYLMKNAARFSTFQIGFSDDEITDEQKKTLKQKVNRSLENWKTVDVTENSCEAYCGNILIKTN